MNENTSEATHHKEIANSHGRYSVWVGGTLIALGVASILSVLGIAQLQNWWALLILIVAVSNFARAWRLFKPSGRLSNDIIWSLALGIVTTAVAFILMLNLSWNIIWPVLLIITGLWLLSPELPWLMRKQ